MASFHSVITVLLEELICVINNVVNLLIVNVNLQDGFTKLPLAICDEFSLRTWRCHYTQKSLLTYLGRRDLVFIQQLLLVLQVLPQEQRLRLPEYLEFQDHLVV